MAKDREVVCVHYEFEGSCQKGREGTFRKACQKCNLYQPLAGGRLARLDHRSRNIDRQNRKEMRDYE